jgi:hypothetical protein
MSTVHHVSTIDLSDIFNILEQEEFENIFLMSDNLKDLNKIRIDNKQNIFYEYHNLTKITGIYYKYNTFSP